MISVAVTVTYVEDYFILKFLRDVPNFPTTVSYRYISWKLILGPVELRI